MQIEEKEKDETHGEKEPRKTVAEKGNVKPKAAASLKRVWASEPAQGKTDSTKPFCLCNRTFLCRKKLTMDIRPKRNAGNSRPPSLS